MQEEEAQDRLGTCIQVTSEVQTVNGRVPATLACLTGVEVGSGSTKVHCSLEIDICASYIVKRASINLGAVDNYVGCTFVTCVPAFGVLGRIHKAEVSLVRVERGTHVLVLGCIHLASVGTLTARTGTELPEGAQSCIPKVSLSLHAQSLRQVIRGHLYAYVCLSIDLNVARSSDD